MTLGKFKGVKLIHLNGTVDANKFIIIKKKRAKSLLRYTDPLFINHVIFDTILLNLVNETEPNTQ